MYKVNCSVLPNIICVGQESLSYIIAKHLVKICISHEIPLLYIYIYIYGRCFCLNNKVIQIHD